MLNRFNKQEISAPPTRFHLNYYSSNISLHLGEWCCRYHIQVRIFIDPSSILPYKRGEIKWIRSVIFPCNRVLESRACFGGNIKFACRNASAGWGPEICFYKTFWTDVEKPSISKVSH
jgi:hypothetical protein